MAKGSELSSSLSLDTTSFKAGIAQANRELRLLDSQFKAGGVATIGNWSQSSVGLEQRINMLNQSIDVQAGKVASLQTEYDRVAEEKGGENSRAAQELQIQLNRETEKLGKLSLELADTEIALEEFGGEESKKSGKEAKSFGEN